MEIVEVCGTCGINGQILWLLFYHFMNVGKEHAFKEILIIKK
jgi:hypothetical protein